MTTRLNPTGKHWAKTSFQKGDRLYWFVSVCIVYLEVKDSFPKLDPLPGVRDGLVEATLGQP